MAVICEYEQSRRVSLRYSNCLIWALMTNLIFPGNTQNAMTPQQKVDQWCNQKFNSDKSACLDLLHRWCDQTQANAAGDQNYHVPDICGSFTQISGGAATNSQAVIAHPPSTQNQVQQTQQQQMQQQQMQQLQQQRLLQQQQSQNSFAPFQPTNQQPVPQIPQAPRPVGPKAQKADPSLLGSVNQVFNNLADGKRQLEDTVKIFSDPIRAAIASPLWPQRSKNYKSKGAVTELSQNDPSKYFHGDVDLTPLQANALLEWAHAQDNQAVLESSGRGRKKRKVARPPAFELWTINPVPYDFDSSVPQTMRNLIRRAIKMWEDNTCRRWKENGVGQDRLQFVDGDGCSSFIGHAGGTQEVSLHTPGCDVAGIAAHEIGHSLGFFHEQSRPDQGDNVKINYKNVRLLVSNNFVPMKEKDVNYYNEPYDFGSVMHYDGLTRGFTYNEDEHSIITLDPLYQNTIGQRNEPSFIDVKQINSAYCSDVCGGLNPNGCLYGGYADPNSCSACKCPSGFAGPKCEGVAQSTIPSCGGVLQATKYPQFFTSPNYPRAFPKNGDCYWQLKAPDQNSRVYIEFVDLFAFPCEDTCASSFVEVKRGPLFERTGYRFCCDAAPQGQPLISEGPLMVVLLHTYGDQTSGFKIRYYSDAGTGTVPPPIPTVARPGGPGKQTLAPGGMKPFVTPAPGPGPTNPPGCQCGEWAQWSGCSQNCGGCGYVRRQRLCNRNDCFDIEKKHCNFQQCTDGGNFMWNNNEFYLLFDGCCVGLLSNGQGQCGGLNTAFTQLIASFIPTGKRRR